MVNDCGIGIRRKYPESQKPSCFFDSWLHLQQPCSPNVVNSGHYCWLGCEPTVTDRKDNTNNNENHDIHMPFSFFLMGDS